MHKYVKYFLKIRVSVLEQMLTARAESVLKMTTNIFMIQLRRMSYQLFYFQEKWGNRRITATIYELSTKEYPTTEKRFKGKLPKTWMQIEHPSNKRTTIPTLRLTFCTGKSLEIIVGR